MAGRRAVESSFNGTMVSSAMYRAGWMAHSSSRSKQDRSDEADNGILVEEDPDNLGPPLGLAVETLDCWSSAAWS
jgi:hypothetical protein